MAQVRPLYPDTPTGPRLVRPEAPSPARPPLSWGQLEAALDLIPGRAESDRPILDGLREAGAVLPIDGRRPSAPWQDDPDSSAGDPFSAHWRRRDIAPAHEARDAAPPMVRPGIAPAYEIRDLAPPMLRPLWFAADLALVAAAVLIAMVWLGTVRAVALLTPLMWGLYAFVVVGGIAWAWRGSLELVAVDMARLLDDPRLWRLHRIGLVRTDGETSFGRAVADALVHFFICAAAAVALFSTAVAVAR